MKFKRMLVLGGIFLFFLIVWFLQNSQYFGFQSYETLKFMNHTAFGYNSLWAFGLFYILPFLIMHNHLYFSESIVQVTRWSRMPLYRHYVLKIGWAALITSFLHMLVNGSLTILFFENSLLLESNYYSVLLVQMVVVFIYFLWVGILYKALTDLFHSMGVAMFATFILIGVIYFLGKLVIPSSTWDPLKDLGLFQKVFEGEWTSIHILIAYTRQLLLVFILYLVGSWIFSRKDFVST